MLANVTAQSKAAEIANIGYLFGSYKAGPVKSKDMPLGKMGNDIQMQYMMNSKLNHRKPDFLSLTNNSDGTSEAYFADNQ